MTPNKYMNSTNATYMSKLSPLFVYIKSTEGFWSSSRTVKSRDTKLERLWHSNALFKQEAMMVKIEIKAK